MTDSVPQRIEALSAQLEGLEAAAEGLEADPSVGVSVRRIARSLETAASLVRNEAGKPLEIASFSTSPSRGG